MKLESYSLNSSHIEELNNFTIITKFNWDYAKALAFQEHAQKIVQDDPQKKFLIFTNHPHVFTVGRGLQRGPGTNKLKDFDEELLSQLPFPGFKIKRGGGLTFHYPGQLVVYPIIRLNINRFKVSCIIDHLFQTAKEVMEEDYHIDSLSIRKDLLGLWKSHQKIASLGVAIDRFVTSHGIAINLIKDQIMSDALAELSPCGMSASKYCFLDQFIENENLIESFYQSIKPKLVEYFSGR